MFNTDKQKFASLSPALKVSYFNLIPRIILGLTKANKIRKSMLDIQLPSLSSSKTLGSGSSSSDSNLKDEKPEKRKFHNLALN